LQLCRCVIDVQMWGYADAQWIRLENL